MLRRIHSILLALPLLAPVAALAQSVDCVIVPAVTVRLGAPVSGLIERVSVEQGDIVQAGQVVATLRADVERTAIEVLALQAGSTAEIEAQKSRLVLAEKRLERMRTLVKGALKPQEQLDTAEAETEVIKRELAIAEMRQQVAGLELSRARQQLEQRQIISPVDGVVVNRVLFDGEFLAQDGYVVTIAQINPLKVEAYMPVSLFRDVAVGDVLTVRPGPPVEGAFDAPIDVVERVFDAASGTFGIRLHLENPDLAIPAGHRCELDLLASSN